MTTSLTKSEDSTSQIYIELSHPLFRFAQKRLTLSLGWSLHLSDGRLKPFFVTDLPESIPNKGPPSWYPSSK